MRTATSHMRPTAFGLLHGAFLCVFWTVLVSDSVRGQVSVLSAGNPAREWRTTQLEILKQQLQDKAVDGAFREELLAQQKWLNAWKPGGLGEEPLWPAPADLKKPAEEPVVDPAELAADLREKLFGAGAKPTVADTTALQELLAAHSGDIGVRQLHLHWLDQKQYRKTYPREIADAALRLFGLLEQVKPQSKEIQQAKAFCLYRRVRALAYRELPEVVKAQPIEDPKEFEAELLGAYSQLTKLGGKERSEFILIEVRMLRRDRFYGRALQQLTDHAQQIDRQWFLKKQRDLLQELGWEFPAKEAAAVYAKAYPQAVAAEQESAGAAKEAEL
jgi:hypothetical protein